MIRAPKLLVSKPMYAFNPTTWREPYSGNFEVDAVWFKRKRHGRGPDATMKLVAVMGTYSPSIFWPPLPTDGEYLSWITAVTDNRYGGRHLSSWDGEALLTTDPPRIPPELAAERTAFLADVLAGYPNPPAGYDGWWTFPKEN